MKKKIAIVLNSSWYAYNFRFNLGCELQRNGFEVIFIAPDNQYIDKFKERFTFYNIKLSKKGINPIEDLITIFNFYKIYRRTKPDIILHYTIKPNIYGTIAADLLGIPTINNIAGLGTLFIRHSLITKIAIFLYRYSQKKASKVFFQNMEDSNLFISGRIAHKVSSDILPGSGVDIEKFKPVDIEDDGMFRFLIVSRMLWAKGIHEYVIAAEILKKKYDKIEFQLLGFLDEDSPTAISKEQMKIWEDSGSICYLGISDDVQNYIAKADCMVLPSYYREGVPRSLLESASMAKPIITTDNVGCKEVVDDGLNGYLCRIKDPQDLADKMEKVLNLSRNERNIMGIAGRQKIIREFDEKIVIDKYLTSINSILENSNIPL